MDKQFILNINNIYIELIKNRKKLKAIDLGLNFLDYFFLEIKEIERLKTTLESKDLVKINFFNFNDQKISQAFVSRELFQRQLQFLYRQFIESNLFTNYTWYNEFHSILKKKLEVSFNYNSENAINLVIQFVSDCFLRCSTEENNYNYSDVKSFLSKNFINIGFIKDHADDMSIQLLDCLFETKLLVFNYAFFEKKFQLSDSIMDVVFNLTSSAIANVSFDDNRIKFNPKIELQNMFGSIKKYKNIWKDMESFNTLTKIFEREHPYFLESLLNDYDLTWDYNNTKNIPKHFLDSYRIFFFKKIFIK